ncbi:hypothetical protein DEO72_LG5g1324 [Vigna unguiculata]|uniref:Zinc-finger domain-containing protein n=1 Tax=Vigna unguiculata TaxID=3917 RepID=A0A4D6LWJ7_VIGUN|nr:hypothetical protein DEO72_LG5g1324 [Vigna unguiculata]
MLWPVLQKGTGKSCHQCRQKEENFAVTCKNFKKGKRCPIKFCNKCLLTRYGENAEMALDLKEGEPEAMLKELVSKGHNSLLIEFHSRLLALILSESGKEKLRRYIKDENSRYAKGVKEAKLKIDATKEKIKCVERKLRNEKAKVVSSTVSPFPMEEKNKNRGFSKFSKRKQHSDIKIEDETATSPEESWSVYSPAEISKYISSM